MSYNISDKELSASLGRLGEEKVAEYLRSKGYIILKRNYKDRFGEIDIIAESRTRLLFVEVKTRSGNPSISGIDAVDVHKRERLKKTAMLFLNRIHLDLQPRFDVAEVTVLSGPDGNLIWKLNYIKSAF